MYPPETNGAGNKIGDVSQRPLVFVIDDHSFVRSSLCQTLESSGFRVREFEDGRVALDAYHQDLPALVITDIFMSAADGYDLIRAFKAIDPQIPIIAMSGGGPIPLENILKMGEILGARRSLIKPFSRADLLAAVENCLNPEAI